MKNRQSLIGLFCVSCLALPFASNAYDAGDIIVRTGPTNVAPNAKSSLVSLGGSSLAGTSVDVEDDTQLGFTITYMLSHRVGIELLASTPFKHEITENGIGVNKIGSAKHLPPTLTAQYYPMPADHAFQPYIGAGLNYTVFFSEETSSALDGALGEGDLSLDDSFGLALKVGADYALNDHWSLSASAWRIDLDTDATINTPSGQVTVDVEIDPWVYMLGLGYNF